MAENIFQPHGRQDVAYNFGDTAWMPTLYADPVLGSTLDRPRMGYWGVTHDDRQVVASGLETGNLFTKALEWVVEPFLPGDQRFVTTGASMRIDEAMGNNTQSHAGARRWLHRLSPVQDATARMQKLEEVDPSFDAEQYANEWVANPENAVVRALALNNNRQDVYAMLREARNEDHAHFIQMHAQRQAAANQAIKEFEKEAGLALRWTSRIADIGTNYMLTDPTTLPAFFIPIGGTQAQAARLGTRAARVVREAGRRTATTIALARGEQGAALAGRVLDASRKLGQGARVLGDSPAAMHFGLASLISHRGAVATEMAMAGGLHAYAVGAERARFSETLTDIEAYQTPLTWDEVGLGIGIGAGAGFLFGGRLNHAINRRAAQREANALSFNAHRGDPIFHSFDNIGGQMVLDHLAVRGQRAAQALLGKSYDEVAAFVLDDDLLLDVGLNRRHMVGILEDLAEASGGELNVNAVRRVLADEITQAARARRAAEWADDAVTNMFEREARANALARAVKENPKRSHTRQFERADELLAEEMDAVLARHQARRARAKSRRPKKDGTPSPSQIKFWKQEAADLAEVASRRDLLQHEMHYLARVESKLIDMGQEAATDALVRARIVAFQGGKGTARFAAGKASKTGKALAQIKRESELVATLPKGKERTNAMSRLRAARKRLAKVAETEKPVETPQEFRKRMAEAKRLASLTDASNPGARAKALDEIIDAIDAGDATLWEDVREVSKFWKTIGLGGLMRRLARAGTGIEETMRSEVAALRWITQEMDHAKLLVDDLDPTKVNTTHDTVQRVVERQAERISEFVDEYRRLHQAGKWGSYTRNPNAYRAKKDAFDRQVIQHIVGAVPSDDADVQRIAAMWKHHADRIGELGAEAGLFGKLDKYFPRRWNTVRIERDQAGFRQALADHFKAKWLESEDVHIGTLVHMGHATREVAEDGTFKGYALVAKNPDSKLDGKVVRTLKRSDLDDLGITEDDYLKGFDILDDDGWTSTQQSANRTLENLTGEAIEEQPNGAIKVRSSGNRGPQSEASRRLEETVWSNPALAEYLDWRFVEGVDSYMRTTGARVENTVRHSRRWGMKGLRMSMTLDHIEGRVVKKLQKAGATKHEVEKARAGFKNLRQKLNFAEGRLPNMEDHLEGWRQYISDLWVNTAGALYGQAIGVTIMFTEVMNSFLNRIYGPADIPRRAVHAFRAFKGATGRPSEAMRLQMQTIGLTQRQFRNHGMQRLMGQSVYGQGHTFGFTPKLLEPWREVFETLAGTNNTYGLGRRIAEMPRAVTKALAANQMQLGGTEFFSTFARMMNVQSAYDEFARFGKAGKQMAALLQDSANVKALSAADDAAFDAAIAAGKSEAAARRLGAKARFKVWKDLARKAGFVNGPWDAAAHWQIAEKWKRHGLLDPGVLEALEEAGVFAKRGTFSTLDYEKLQRAVGRTPEEDALLQDAKDRIHGLLTETIRKRVSEQSIMQTPTTTFARSPMGRTLNSMTTWTRSFHDNNLMDTAQMPLRIGAGMVGALLAGESINMVVRELWKGKDWEDVWEEMQDDPDNWVMRAATSIPWLGQFGGWTRPVADAITSNERIYRMDLGESAAEGAAAAVSDLGIQAMRSLASDDPVAARTWRTASRFMPGWRSHVGLAVNFGVEQTTGVDLINKMSPQRKRSIVDTVEAAPLQNDEDFFLQPELKPDLPEDVSFLYPEK